MAQNQSKKDDLLISTNFNNGCDIVASHKIKEFSDYLFQDDIFPFSQEIWRQIKPKSDSSFEIERCFNIFITIYKSNALSFHKSPFFVLSYCSICLRNHILFEIATKFITDYLNQLTEFPNSAILDILIPFALFHQISKEQSKLFLRFILDLCQKFECSVFLNHFLPILRFLISNQSSEFKINHFHLEILLAIIETYDVNPEQIEQIQNEILSPFENDESILLIKSSLSISGMLNIQKTDETNNSFITPIDIPKQQDESLEELLQEVQSQSYESAPIILGHIRIQFERRSDFPDFDFKSLFELAIETYPSSNEITRSTIYCIISFLNQKFSKNPEELLNLYISTAKQGQYDIQFLNLCYQDFLQEIADDPEIYDKYGQLIDTAPINLLNCQLNITSPTNSIQKAFSYLRNWDTAYDGVQKVWREIIRNPEICLFDDIKCLEYSQKHYLLQGLQTNLEFSEPILGVNLAIDKIAEFIESDESPSTQTSPLNKKRRTLSPATKK